MPIYRLDRCLNNFIDDPRVTILQIIAIQLGDGDNNDKPYSHVHSKVHLDMAETGLN